MIDGRRSRTTKEAEGDKTPTPRHVEEPTPATSPQKSRPALWRRLALGSRLARHGVTPNEVTVAGLLLAAVTGTVIALGHLYLAVALVTAGGLMDTLDGAVAKAAGASSRRGAFLDSVSDRIADGFMFGGLAWYLGSGGHPELALFPFGILAVGNLISYERAKAETFGWDARGGLMERAERLIGLGIALLFHVVLVPLLVTLLALCVVTAIQRFVKIWGQATAELTGEPAPVRVVPLAAWRPARVESRWRAWREARALESAHRRPVAPRRRPRRHTTEPLSHRLRSVLAAEHAEGGPSRDRRAQRREQGTAAALRRRFGTGR